MDYTKKNFKWKNCRPLAAIIFCLVLSACSDPAMNNELPKKRELALPVQIGKVVYKDVVDGVRTVGNIQSEKRVTLTSEITGQVLDVFIEEGQRARAGQTLVAIDSREYELEMERLESERTAAEKEYEKAQEGLRPEEQDRLDAQVKADESAWNLTLKEQRRTEKLTEEGVLAVSVLDEAVDKTQRAEETVRASRAAREAGKTSREEDIVQKKSDLDVAIKRRAMAALDLSKTLIVAPFDGVIVSKNIEKGALAQPGTPLVEMISSSKLKAVVELPQSYRGKLAELTNVQFFIPELNLKFDQNKNLKKHVRVVPDANIFSGNIQVQINLVKPDPKIFPGLTLECLMQFQTRKQALHVPSVSLAISEQGSAVYVIKEERAHLIPVKAFREKDGYVEIEDFTHQLKADADLVLRGSGAVFPGVKVFITNPKSKNKNSPTAASAPPPAENATAKKQKAG